MLPNFSMSELALMIFILPIAISWWANWYPGAEPGGGSYIAQRMLASQVGKGRTRRHALLQHRALRAAAVAVDHHGALLDHRLSRSGVDPGRVPAAPTRRSSGTTRHFPAMLKFLPVGFVGLMIGGLLAANSSTILTHLNWGSSYLVHDFYRRFIRKDASESHYVNAGRLCTVLLTSWRRCSA